MIVLDKKDMKDQAGMEHAFNSYFKYMELECEGTFNAMMGPRFETCDFAKKTLTLSMESVSWMTNPSEMLHGGISAAILDMTMGLLCRYVSGGYMTPTISLGVNYLRPGPLGKKLLIKAEITKRGMSVCHAVGSMWAEGAEDDLIATATGSYYVTRTPG